MNQSEIIENIHIGLEPLIENLIPPRLCWYKASYLLLCNSGYKFQVLDSKVNITSIMLFNISVYQWNIWPKFSIY
jgi:hypothetical protein